MTAIHFLKLITYFWFMFHLLAGFPLKHVIIHYYWEIKIWTNYFLLLFFLIHGLSSRDVTNAMDNGLVLWNLEALFRTAPRFVRSSLEFSRLFSSMVDGTEIKECISSMIYNKPIYKLSRWNHIFNSVSL